MNRIIVEEPGTKTEFWYEWISYRIRHYFILDVVFLVFFCFLLSHSIQIKAQNEQTYQLISRLQFQIENLEKRLDDQPRKSASEGSVLEPANVKPAAIQSEEFVLGSFGVTTGKPVTKNPIVHLKAHQSDSMNCSLPIFNAANFLIGAKVVNGGADELILLDRPNPPENAAWCSDEKEPIVIIKLAKYIKSVSVSYQHSKWIGKVPYGAPKSYDVHACFDEECKSWEPLVSDCEYKYESGIQEQFCNVTKNLHLPPIGTVLFQFKENHGHEKETCVSLLRVYGEERKQPVDREKQLENEETCSSIAWQYHNFPPFYTMRQKNCSTLYSMECCDECPECCDECLINDSTFLQFVYWALVGALFFFGFLFLGALIGHLANKS